MLLSHAQIIEKIKLDTKVNFVALVRTPWHALGCNASLLKLKEQGEKLNGLVVLSEDSYDRENPLLSADNFNVLADNEIGFELLYFNGNAFSSSTADNIKIKLQSMSYLANHKKGARRIYVLNPMHINDIFVTRLKKIVPDSDIVNIVIDEGLGVYMRSGFNWAVEQYHNTNSIKEFLRMIFDLQKKRLYVKKSIKRSEYINNNILIDNDGRFEENKGITTYYRRAIDCDKVSGEKYSKYSDSVVISAQLYFEDNQIKNNADLELYKKIISALSEKNIGVVFKPHPRDKDLSRYDCLDCFVDADNTVSQESILASLDVKPRAVFSFTSTSLVTSPLFYGVKTASLNSLLPKENVQLTLLNEFSNFKKAFENVVYIPDTSEQLLHYINE